MGVFPTLADVEKIERRAEQIADPIHRLRYLRHAAEIPPRPKPGRGSFAASLLIVVLALPLQTQSDAHVTRTPDQILPPPPTVQYGSQIPNVWLVDKTKEFEVYSNGLRIENQLAVSGQPRWYTLLNRDLTAGPRRSEPAGIVFHTTESDLAPFEADQNHALERIGRELLLYVRSKRAYHFVIDRFGRVHRIVAESDVANHAGNSAWADGRWSYINLNTNFLGVALEAHTEPDKPALNEAQVHALKVLTGMLRCKYGLLAENCVTHAQVSVNPSNMRIGWHTDWGTGFPFKQIGLPDNYERRSPVLSLFGFTYDAAYVRATSPAIWKALALSEDELRQAAAVKGMEIAGYRRLLQKRYLDQSEALRKQGANEEN